MTEVVGFKLINGTDIIGKLNTDASVVAEYAHIPNAVVLDDALIIMANVVTDPDGSNPRVRVGFEQIAYAIEGQSAARVAFAGASLLQFPVDSSYVDGYLRSLSPLVLPSGGGGKIITG